MIIDCQKSLFSIPDDVTYLNCAFMSPQMKAISEAAHTALVKKENPWLVEPSDFFKDVEICRKKFSQIINTSPDSIAIIPSVSYGLAIAAKNINLKPNGKIVLVSEQFPSNFYIWNELIKQKKLSPIIVEKALDTDLTAQILENINDDTSIIAIPTVHWTDGTKINLEEIGKYAREKDAVLVVDGTQSVGAMPFNASRIKPDFMITAGYKWLLGPYNLGYMYVDKKYWNGAPIEYNWANRHGCEDFSNLVNYQDKYQKGARRFDMGEKSQFLQMPMAKIALDQILSWGIENIAESLKVLTEMASKEAEKLDLKVCSSNQQSPHMIGLTYSDQKVSSQLLDKLRQDKIYVSVRGHSIRISPHLYNQKADIKKLISLLKTLS